jgi:hypothetical protein
LFRSSRKIVPTSKKWIRKNGYRYVRVNERKTDYLWRR